MTEDEWWQNLTGQDVFDNAYGVPPYDLQPVIDIIESHVHFGGAVIDLGCGPGRLGHELARRHPLTWILGLDVSSEMLGMSLRDAAPPNWRALPAATVVSPNLYDGCYSVTVFQHLAHDVVRDYLARVHDALVDGGRFVFTFAIGTEDTFLSHQVAHQDLFKWMWDAGFKAQWIYGGGTPWHWMVGQK